MAKDTKDTKDTKHSSEKEHSSDKDKRHSSEKEHSSHKDEKHSSGGKKTHHEIMAENLTPEERKFLEQHIGELSPTTLRAKWINNLDEHEDHPGQSLATQSPEVIKHWAEERKAVPATVPGTEHGDHLGVLRFNFPGYGGQSLQEVSWDQWLNTFKDRKLVFLFQERMRNGHQSNFFHMDSPYREHD